MRVCDGFAKTLCGVPLCVIDREPISVHARARGPSTLCAQEVRSHTRVHQVFGKFGNDVLSLCVNVRDLTLSNSLGTLCIRDLKGI